jgi:hypothetical protein
VLEIIQFPFQPYSVCMTKVAVRRGKPDIFPPTYCLNCALAEYVTSPKAICSRPVVIGAWVRRLCDERAATCESSRNFFLAADAKIMQCPPGWIYINCICVYVCAGCSAVAMVVTSVSNGEKCLFAESVAAAVRVLVSQRPNDQL